MPHVVASGIPYVGISIDLGLSIDMGTTYGYLIWYANAHNRFGVNS